MAVVTDVNRCNPNEKVDTEEGRYAKVGTAECFRKLVGTMLTVVN